ncbi:MAG: formyltetrahydrofolate deformylase [Porticoccaceae bacterium]|jgi:formyltetrahydrofolate deformylase|nr:MAG: formyltetrahydrofolate deformylase [SAR92 bacterium BACL16 MAG-120619-bin48]MDP4743766.1 formyltetrahydrofolate deformylase [Porticoccaceae bacterium]MDP4752018.1 formyltetrahydrofolate deformylase [Porticoccaceae bacterium]MDP4889341.1 formyltetrahydrofolate deformylase [Porticoccaceae bacterium]MDP4988347.1 formyltetrahydrofolate deformylase [Porticoccaceae bacterium]
MNSPTDSAKTYIFTGTCRAGSGVVAAVTSFLAERDCYICALEQFDDESTGKFFMRAVFRLQANSPAIETIKNTFHQVSNTFDMEWHIYDPDVPVKTLILVSKFDHCLDDILYRRRKGEFNMEIAAVVSNHLDLRAMVEREGLRFIHLPVTAETKALQEQQLLELIDETRAELVVLARYMQILSDGLSQQLAGRCINIHHSFLPGFKGAKPYHQAYDRGVKLIGATAHYVTSNLDEGPIIEQVLTRVDHNFKPEHLVRVGRDNECMALARAITYHIERRVFLDGNKTVVFLAG